VHAFLAAEIRSGQKLTYPAGEGMLAQFSQINHPDVEIRPDWYYY